MSWSSPLCRAPWLGTPDSRAKNLALPRRPVKRQLTPTQEVPWIFLQFAICVRFLPEKFTLPLFCQTLGAHANLTHLPGSPILMTSCSWHWEPPLQLCFSDGFCVGIPCVPGSDDAFASWTDNNVRYFQSRIVTQMREDNEPATSVGWRKCVTRRPRKGQE